MYSQAKSNILFVLLTVLFCFPLKCTDHNAQKIEDTVQKKSIKEVLNAYTPNLMKVPGVIGTALGEHEGKQCIIVMISVKTEYASGKIPSSIEGYTVQIKETGEIRARDSKN